MGSMLEEK